MAKTPSPNLPAILVTGVYYSSTYEIYAHERLAKLAGLTWRQIDFIKAGSKPPADGVDALDEQCSVAYDIAIEMLRGSGSKGGLVRKGCVHVM